MQAWTCAPKAWKNSTLITILLVVVVGFGQTRAVEQNNKERYNPKSEKYSVGAAPRPQRCVVDSLVLIPICFFPKSTTMRPPIRIPLGYPPQNPYLAGTLTEKQKSFTIPLKFQASKRQQLKMAPTGPVSKFKSSSFLKVVCARWGAEGGSLLVPLYETQM